MNTDGTGAFRRAAAAGIVLPLAFAAIWWTGGMLKLFDAGHWLSLSAFALVFFASGIVLSIYIERRIPTKVLYLLGVLGWLLSLCGALWMGFYGAP